MNTKFITKINEVIENKEDISKEELESILELVTLMDRRFGNQFDCSYISTWKAVESLRANLEEKLRYKFR